MSEGWGEVGTRGRGVRDGVKLGTRGESEGWGEVGDKGEVSEGWGEVGTRGR